MMIFCMLLTQNTKNLILKSQYSVPNLISELQSDKIKANGPEILDEGISQFFFYLKQKHACIKLVYLSDGWRYYKEGIVHPWDTTTHCRSAIPVWQYLKLNTYLQESQQTPPPLLLPLTPLLPSMSITTVVDYENTKRQQRRAPLSIS